MNKTRYLDKLPALLIAALLAVCAFFTLIHYTSDTIARMVVTGKFPAGTTLEVQFETVTGYTRQELIQVPDSPGGKTVRFGTSRMNFPGRTIRLLFRAPAADASTAPRYLNIHHLQFELPYARDVFIAQSRLAEVFFSEQFGELAVPALDPATNSATLELRQPLVTKSPLVPVLLCMLFGLAIYLLIVHTNWRAIPAISDMGLGNKISTRPEFDSINGLRGLAAIMVLLSHTAPGFTSNRIGIALLFLFSGFLLSKPFIMNPIRIFSWSTIQVYLTKRLKRILPVYYLYIFVIYMVPLEIDTAVRHFLFVEARGHLWPMNQIFTFYMLLPLVLLICCSAYKVNKLLPLVLLSTAIYFWLTMMMDWRPYYGGDHGNPFYFYTFLMGVLGAYLQYDKNPRLQAARDWLYTQRRLWAPIAFLILVLTIAWSAPVPPPAILAAPLNQFFVKCILCMIIILLTLNLRSSWYSAILSNWLFRSVGVVGFSFYIWHGFGMQLVQAIQVQLLGLAEPSTRSWGFMLSAFAVTYVLALISYSWVERPFFGYREKKPVQAQ